MMRIHCVSYYEESDAAELVEIDYQCSAACMRSTLERECDVTGVDVAGTLNLPDGGSVSWGGWPGGSETDYDVYCSTCETLLWRGLSSDEEECDEEPDEDEPDPDAGCRLHGLMDCNAPECIGILRSEVRDAELWGGTE